MVRIPFFLIVFGLILFLPSLGLCKMGSLGKTFAIGGAVSSSFDGVCLRYRPPGENYGLGGIVAVREKDWGIDARCFYGLLKRPRYELYVGGGVECGSLVGSDNRLVLLVYCGGETHLPSLPELSGALEIGAGLGLGVHITLSVFYYIF